MAYHMFATVYDQLMEEAPYDEWIQYVKNAFNGSVKGKTIVDLGCGTGELYLRLHEEGANVIGIDISEQMLAIAAQKCARKKIKPQFLLQSMTQFDLGVDEKVDGITIFCDSLNYLTTKKDVLQTFIRCYHALSPGGLLLFDVHSTFKMEQWVGKRFADDFGHFAYIWTVFSGAHEASVEHELSFFIHEDNGCYIKYEEEHHQRTFSLKQYTKWLQRAGFQDDIAITADFTPHFPTAKSERIFFVCRK